MDKRMPVDRPATPVFYAHSLPGCAREEWERLEWHLRRAGALARRFARSFGAGNWGAAAGLLHDLGKYSQEFQGRLSGDYGRVDHSTAGAQEARRYGHVGTLLAYGIAGHHAGLPDGGEADDSALVSRLNNKKTVPAVDNSWRERIALPERAELEAEIRAVLGKGGGFSAAFFARMLFSCLVDADFIATEWFLDKKRRRERGRRLPRPSDLAPLLRAYLGTRFGAPDTEINRQRAAIREACQAAANEGPGVFSLSVPTGGGKTLSSLSFALEHAAKHDLARVIYAVPYTAIIEQIADEFRKALAVAGDDVVLEHHSAAEPPPADETRLVGPQRLYLATENWDAPLIVTTTVQLFESLFAARPSRCRKLHNLARSVIVLDEVQALPIGQLHACLASLGELVSRYGATVVLCSATVPDFKASSVLNAALPEPRSVVPQTSALHAAFTRVRSECAADPLDDEMLAARLAEAPQVLCIVDTRAHAAELFDRLPGEGRFHLSASMCPAHRRQELRRAKAALSEGRLCRLIATKVIEAGVDISFPEVWRAMAGIDSLAQAAGRCNRHGEKRDGPGKFVVFNSLRPDALPRNLADLRRRATIARYILEDHEDPIASGAVAAYFARLFKDSDDMDAEKCWKALADVRDITAIPFRLVAEKFRMIDDDQTPLFVPWNDEARQCIERLSGILRRQTEAPRRIPVELLRSLQAYAVGVHGLEQLQAHVGPLDPEGRFHVLHDMGLYDGATGLRIERAGLRSPSANLL
jgi:CRISPR-associated helicase Cas3/CRISPR-associated endonuclease Cas3-HD